MTLREFLNAVVELYTFALAEWTAFGRTQRKPIDDSEKLSEEEIAEVNRQIVELERIEERFKRMAKAQSNPERSPAAEERLRRLTQR